MASQSVWKYRWFDTPNNQDGLYKAVALGKITGKVGFALGMADALFAEPKLNNLQKAVRVGSWVLPALGMSTAFTITEQVSLKLFPNLDEKFAFMFGGMAAAGIMGHAFKSGQMAFTASILFGAAGFAYQYMREGRAEAPGTKWSEQFQFFPDHPDFILYERAQRSHWLINTYDWRKDKHSKRGAEIYENLG